MASESDLLQLEGLVLHIRHPRTGESLELAFPPGVNTRVLEVDFPARTAHVVARLVKSQEGEFDLRFTIGQEAVREGSARLHVNAPEGAVLPDPREIFGFHQPKAFPEAEEKEAPKAEEAPVAPSPAKVEETFEVVASPVKMEKVEKVAEKKGEKKGGH